mmetsp:Transcript_1828/g.2605  ORF Transcript_1828/g.2605 Transcript_1828/m.2605 type:complete len:524 (-) Transcript_1828:166-1737(-)
MCPSNTKATKLATEGASSKAKMSVRGAMAENRPDAESQSYFTLVTTLMGFIVIEILGRMRDFSARVTGVSRYYDEIVGASDDPNMAPIIFGKDNFYQRRLYHRIQDCWNRPISSKPGARIDVIKRTTKDGGKTYQMQPGETKNCLNLGSYNYLGFADDWNSTCGTKVRKGLDKYGVSTCSAAVDAGSTAVHKELEAYVAKFLGKEDAVVFNMGYGTNTSALEALGGKGSLILSDALNHTSIVNGCRAAYAKVKPFKHNDEKDLEEKLISAISEGRPSKDGSFTPWTKIIVVVEGIYSMEGEVCRLREIVDVAKKYKAYMYVDEAHSIGALGKTGRGVCEHTGVNHDEIDVLMGTFSKSFGGMGGYIAASKEVIDYVRSTSPGCLYTCSLSPTVATQILTAFHIITGDDGTDLGKRKLERIKSNSNYFRTELRRMGLTVLGDKDSPVIPMMLYNGPKIAAFSRECYDRGIAAVVVGYPAVPVYGGRVRFCISAGHEPADLKDAIKKIKDICKILNLRYQRSMFG